MPENPLTTVIEQVTALLTELRERGEAAGGEAQRRLGEAQAMAQSRVDDTRDSALALFEDAKSKLSSLPVEVPTEIDDLFTRFSPEELRKVAEAYLAVAAGLLTALSERREEVVDKLRSQPIVGESLPRLEKVYNDAVGLTEDALGTISGQTRAVGERAAALAGLGLAKADEVTLPPAEETPAEETPAEETPATKAPAPTETPAPTPAKKAEAKAPAKKTPAATAPAKKTAAKAPAKKTPAATAPAKKTAAKAPAKKTSATKAPAKKAAEETEPTKAAAKKAPAKKTPAKKTSATTAAKKAPAKKAPAKKAPAGPSADA
ncbi:hypothetical protein [Gordonia rhizosphera]|uniref:Heparin-binding hemagglutinin n=1 Tax=Gordonia rhizosphera NBRC 16068 TaxID=1108045 RepID=K6W5F7_9ACTN|nr:hypothetical protein [Gordonia rhizosphera]GAB88941.1 hypothetical protein GORHZ_046_00910 [Gordonia rhizosphera NBRC 16068]